MRRIFSISILCQSFVCLSIISCFFSFFLINAGFTGDTLVKTSQGLIPIQYLRVGDNITCLDENFNITEKPITAIQKKEVYEIIKIIMEDETIFYISKDNTIYAPAMQRWIQSDELKSSDLLLTAKLTSIKIKDIVRQFGLTTIFNITVEKHHNFCITEEGIVVHNMNVVLEWVAENGSTVLANAQNALIQAGTVVVLYLTTSNNEKDYSIPQLPGKPGDQFKLNGQDFIYTSDGWKLQSELEPDQVLNLKKQAFENRHANTTQPSVNDICEDVVIEPEYTYVAREGWTNNQTWWTPVGTRLYSECCTVGADGITILFYNLARDAQITKDLLAKYEAQKQRVANKSSSSCVGDIGNDDSQKPCWCGCGFRGVGCACTCQCTCNKKDKSATDKNGYTYENGIYADAKYHHANSTGNSQGGKGPAPKDGQRILDNSFEVGSDSKRRVGIDSDGKFVVFDQTSKGICPYSKCLFHGHIRTWEEICSEPKGNIKNAFINNGLTNSKGKILK